jgi:hypothetical protein
VERKAVEFWADGNDLPLLAVGREVRIQFEGWPAIQFSGWPKASYGTFRGVVQVVDAAGDGHGRFRLLVVPQEGYEWPGEFLRQGTLAQGWILLGTVSLGFEVWRQFNGFPKEYLPPVSASGRGDN